MVKKTKCFGTTTVEVRACSILPASWGVLAELPWLRTTGSGGTLSENPLRALMFWDSLRHRRHLLEVSLEALSVPAVTRVRIVGAAVVSVARMG